MARRKKASKVLENSQKRLAGMQAISPTLDLGSGLSVPGFATEVSSLDKLLAAYNTILAQSDSAKNAVHAQEKHLRDLSERMLEGIGSRFGHDSNQYEMAGGTRKSERKRSLRKPPPAEAA